MQEMWSSVCFPFSNFVPRRVSHVDFKRFAKNKWSEVLHEPGCWDETQTFISQIRRCVDHRNQSKQQLGNLPFESRKIGLFENMLKLQPFLHHLFAYLKQFPDSTNGPAMFRLRSAATTQKKDEKGWSMKRHNNGRGQILWGKWIKAKNLKNISVSIGKWSAKEGATVLFCRSCSQLINEVFTRHLPEALFTQQASGKFR